jgi:hypothetical protein
LSTFQNMWITKQEYDESGPGIVHRSKHSFVSRKDKMLKDSSQRHSNKAMVLIYYAPLDKWFCCNSTKHVLKYKVILLEKIWISNTWTI